MNDILVTQVWLSTEVDYNTLPAKTRERVVDALLDVVDYLKRIRGVE